MTDKDLSNSNRQELERKYNSLYQSYKSVLEDLQTEMELMFKQIPFHPTIKSRVKSFKSYYRKILNKLKDSQLPEQGSIIPDMLGVRIICPFLEDLKEIETVLRRNFQIIEFERKGNYSFREFGYESTHLLITIPPEIIKKHHLEEGEEDLVCEIQIRTILQDAWAVVEHELIYKAGFSPFDEPLKRKLAALNANLTLSDIIFQEIRNYQRQLHLELKKRRQSFFKEVRRLSPVQSRDDIKEIAREDSEAGMEINRSVLKAKEPVHKTIDDLLLDALYAHNAHKIVKAIEIYTYILSLKPKEQLQSIIYIHRGMAYFSKSRYNLALKDFSKALELDPKNEKAFYYRGVMLSITKKYPAALEDFNRSLWLNPGQADPLLSRAQVFFHLGDYPRALADCEEALSIEPKLDQLLLFRNFIRSKLESRANNLI